VLPASAIDDELERDNTAGGQRQAAAARAALPSAAAKQLAWDSVVKADDLPNAILSATVGGFAQPDQRELLVPYVDKYFESLTEIWKTRTNEIAQSLTTGLFPSLLASQDILNRADKFLATDKDAGSTRLIKELRDNVARSLNCQSVDV
jgi:aminopeptidase N